MNSLNELQPYIQPYAAELIRRFAPYGVSITSTYRAPWEQARLYANYLRGGSRYPVAPPGRSLHEYRRALDVFAPSWLLPYMGQLWQYWGGRWGGFERDPIHFEA